jgi:hypothetical protein
MSLSSCRKPRFFFIIFILFVPFLLMSCAATRKNLEVSPSFNKSHYKTIGLLVVRVGCQCPAGVSWAIPTLKTDYANRSPQMIKIGAFSSDPPVPVYIEDETRLKQSFPFYPRTTEKPIHSIGWGAPLVNDTYEFYGNLTPQMYGTVSNVLKNKGYTVVDIRMASEAWKKPVSEATVEEIIQQSGSLADAILIIQYMDVGSTTSSLLLDSSAFSNSAGLSNIEYNVSLFDTKTKERVFSFSKDGLGSLTYVIIHDPDIVNDPAKRSKISSQITGNPTGGESEIITLSFTNEEMVGFLMKYIAKGVPGEKGRQKWTGLEEAIP